MSALDDSLQMKKTSSMSSQPPSREQSMMGDPTVITEASREIIRKLREQIPELQPTSPLYIRFDDVYLNRFVRARQYRLNDVVIMVNNHIQWLREFHVADIMEFRFEELEQFRTVYPHGYHGIDKVGRPIYIERYAKMNADYLHKITTLDRIAKYWVRGYEILLYQRFPVCRPGITQSTVILDLAGVRLSTFDSRAREFLRLISKISSDNYPETLGAMFIVNVPSFFSIVYNVAKPFIPPETKRKIHVVTAKNVKAELLKHIDQDQLPAFLGGECVCDSNSTTDDRGCLSSDRGPWKDTMPDLHDKDEFVSCVDYGESRGSFAIEHFQTPVGTLTNLPSVTEEKSERKGTQRFGLFSCCRSPPRKH
jgi:hypothetical protein